MTERRKTGGGEMDRERRRSVELEGRERREGGWDAKEGESEDEVPPRQERWPANRVQICESEFV